MTPWHAAVDPETAPSACEGPSPAVAEQLAIIDTSVLERAVQVRSEQVRVDTFRQRAQELTGAFAGAVRQRVMEDYECQHAALEQQLVLMKAQVGTECEKLRALLDAIRATIDATSLKMEEQEFRHAVGELSDAELGEQAQQLQQILDPCRADLAIVEQLNACFVEAFEPGEPLAVDQQPAAGDASAGPEHALTGQTMPALAGVGRDDEDDRTRLAVDAGHLPAASPCSGSAQTEMAADCTVAVPLAALVVEAGDLVNTAYPLGMLNQIGRFQDNHIQLVKPSVSRHHARIMLTPSGFSLEHVGSANGTFVNGRQVSQALLSDGDRIDIGEVRLIFWSPWPRAGRAW